MTTVQRFTLLLASLTLLAFPADAAARCDRCTSPPDGFCWGCYPCNGQGDCVTNCTQPECDRCSPGGGSCSGFALLEDGSSPMIASSGDILVLDGTAYRVRACSEAIREQNALLEAAAATHLALTLM